MLQRIVDIVVGRKEPSEDRIIKLEKKVGNIDVRLAVLNGRVRVKERVHQ